MAVSMWSHMRDSLLAWDRGVMRDHSAEASLGFWLWSGGSEPSRRCSSPTRALSPQGRKAPECGDSQWPQPPHSQEAPGSEVGHGQHWGVAEGSGTRRAWAWVLPCYWPAPPARNGLSSSASRA